MSMKSTMAAAVSVTLLTLGILAAMPTASNAAGQKDPGRHQRMAKYVAEHGARVTRHAKLTPEQKHARAVRYAKEHKARMHRHRALVRAQHRHEG